MTPFIKNVITLIGSSTILLTILTYIAKFFFNQIAEIKKNTREYNLQIKQFEHELRFGWVYQKQMELIEHIYNEIKILNRYIISCRDDLYPIGDTIIEGVSFKEIQDKNKPLSQFINSKSLYFSKEMNGELLNVVDTFERAAQSIGIEQIFRKQNQNKELDDRETILYNTMFMKQLMSNNSQNNEEELKNQLKACSQEDIQGALYSADRVIASLEDEFRKIIGVEEKDSQLKKTDNI